MDDIVHFLLNLYYKTYAVKGFDVGSYRALSERSLLALHCCYKEGRKMVVNTVPSRTISVDIMCDQM